MRRIAALFFVTALCVTALSVGTLAVAAPRPNSVAVMDTQPQNVSDAIAALTTQTIASYLANNLGMDVVAKDDLKRLVNFEQQRQLLGCDSDACAQAAPVGEALGVEKLLTSTIGRIGERLQLSVIVLDVVSSKVTGRMTREIRTEDEIVENARDLAHFAVKKEPRESKGYARIEVPSVGASIILDGAAYGVSPLATPARLLAGRHAVRVEKEGFIPFDGSVQIDVGKETILEVKLIPKKDIKVAGAGFLPWAGAAAGVAVVAGVVSGWSYSKANALYTDTYLNEDKPISKSELDQARKDVDFFGNTVHYYSAWSAGILGGVSVGLFSAYFLSGLGAGGDEPPAVAPAFTVEPTPDGVAIRF